MKLSSRSYPYPVVGNRDDVPGAAFQTILEMSSDKEMVYIDATIVCSSTTINSLVKSGDSTFVVHVECSNTLFRRAYEFHSPSHRIAVPHDYLNDLVEVNVFARAAKHLSGYQVDKAHQDYGNAVFEVENGDILAVGEGQTFPVESSFDSLSRIGSIMEVQESIKDDDSPVRADYNGQKIVIILSKKDFADYKLLKNADGVSVALTTAIVLPVLMEALHQCNEEAEDDRRWIRAIRHRLEAMNLKLGGDSMETAQLLLELPVRRTLSSARMAAEGDS